MTEEECLQLKRLVRSRIALLEEVLGGAVVVSDKKQEQEDDEAANLDLTINSAVESRVVENTKLELVRLKRNLQWLNSEDAGYCEQCGREIPFARLKTVPDTQFCVFCADSSRKS
ncbi:TraR/DksA family transcriptional regulator [Methylomarinum vadi]|uniref:TraR/DksA family transcriptional regulator n=1 Tax=Methylomarinum vadi TaxID=438855 RepID=UPI0005691AAF|nr:TraR/DksA C4-type zinc finger protein [Methylomarinum vadi]